jgi:hypothetical protein
MTEYILIYPGFARSPGWCHVIADREAGTRSVLVGDLSDNPGTSVINATEQIAALISEHLFDGAEPSEFAMFEYEPRGTRDLAATFLRVDWHGQPGTFSMPTWTPVDPTTEPSLRKALSRVRADAYTFDALTAERELELIDGAGSEQVVRRAKARTVSPEAFRQAMTPTIKALSSFAAAVTDLVARPALPDSPALRELDAEPELRTRSDWINPIADTHLFGAMTLRAAADHLAAFAELFDARQPPVYAHLTVARTAMEHSALAAWLSDPQIGPEARAKRGMCERLYSAKTAARALGSEEPGATLAQYELDARRLGWETHFDAADRPTVDDTSWPSIPESVATLLGIQDAAAARNALWRRLTAVTHGAWWGLDWALMTDVATPSAPGHAQVPFGTDSVKVAMPAVGVLRVMREAATTRFALTGWAGSAEWRAASNDSVVLEQTLMTMVNGAYSTTNPSS